MPPSGLGIRRRIRSRSGKRAEQVKAGKCELKTHLAECTAECTRRLAGCIALARQDSSPMIGMSDGVRSATDGEVF